LFPSFKEIREISAVIGAAVAAKAYQLGTIPVTFSFDSSVVLACPNECLESLIFPRRYTFQLEVVSYPEVWEMLLITT
jgi:hypothetical protein